MLERILFLVRPAVVLKIPRTINCQIESQWKDRYMFKLCFIHKFIFICLSLSCNYYLFSRINYLIIFYSCVYFLRLIQSRAVSFSLPGLRFLGNIPIVLAYLFDSDTSLLTKGNPRTSRKGEL